MAPTVLFLLFSLSSSTKWYDKKALQKPFEIELVSFEQRNACTAGTGKTCTRYCLVSRERQSHKIQCRRQEKLVLVLKVAPVSRIHHLFPPS